MAARAPERPAGGTGLGGRGAGGRGAGGRGVGGRGGGQGGGRLGYPSGLWWVSPVGAVALVVPVSLWYAATLDDSAYRLFWRTPKSLTSSTVALVAAGALVLVVGMLLVRALAPVRRIRRWPGLDDLQQERLGRASSVVFWLTVVGYGAFAVAAALRGLSLSALLQSFVDQDNYSAEFREQLAPVPGVTTLTQCGVAYVVIAAVLLAHGRDARTTRRLVVVLLLALVRSFVNTERLALIELGVPLAVVAFVALRRQGGRVVRRAVVLAPAVLAPLLVAVFGVFEYSRSWQFFQSRTAQSFPEFVVTRIAGYYATAYNNGQLRLDAETYPGRLPYESVQAFWDAPGIAQADLYDRLSAPPPLSSTDALERFGNPEFNNPGGLTVPFVDFGVVGGLVFFLVAGLLLGLAYQQFVEGRITGLLLYPVAVTGIFDLPRYIYWTQGRVLPAVLCVLAVALYLRRRPPRRRAGGPLVPQREPVEAP